MKVCKQFIDVPDGVCVLLSDVDAFVPEMSLPIEQILQQFAYVDNVRLGDLARQGFEHADANEDDFDVENFDSLDYAERDDIYNQAKQIVEKYEEEKRRFDEQRSHLEGDEVE